MICAVRMVGRNLEKHRGTPSGKIGCHGNGRIHFGVRAGIIHIKRRGESRIG